MRLIKNTFIMFWVFHFIGCGQKIPEKQSRDVPVVPTPSSQDSPSLFEKEANTTLDQVFGSSFFVLHFAKPEQSLQQIKNIFGQKNGFLENSFVKIFLNEFQKQTDIDLRKKNIFQDIGINPHQGISFAMDNGFLYKQAKDLPLAATIELRRYPLRYFVLGLQEKNLFYQWFKERLPTLDSTSTFRFEDELAGELKVIYVYKNTKADSSLKLPPKTPNNISGFSSDITLAESLEKKNNLTGLPLQSTWSFWKELKHFNSKTSFFSQIIFHKVLSYESLLKRVLIKEPADFLYIPPEPIIPNLLNETLIAALVNQGDYVYLFWVNDLVKPATPDIPDVVVTFKNSLKEFFSNPANTLSENKRFQETTNKMQTDKDAFFYLDLEDMYQVMQKKLAPEFVFLTPKNSSQQSKQEAQKKSAALLGRSVGNSISFSYLASLFFPSLSLSVSLEADKAIFNGNGLFGSQIKTEASDLFASSLPVPPYEALYSEKTEFFLRASLNPSMIKSLLDLSLPQAEKELFKKSWEKINTAFSQETGLSLDSDVLDVLSGHWAFGGDFFSSLLNPLLFGFPGTPITFSGIFWAVQAQDKIAAEKLAFSLSTMLRKKFRVPIKEERVEGYTIYSTVILKRFSLSWAQVEELLLLGGNNTTIKEALLRTKIPKSSFASKDSIKSLASEDTLNGITLNLASFLATYVQIIPSSEPTKKAMIESLRTSLGTGTFYSYLQENELKFYGEILWQNTP